MEIVSSNVNKKLEKLKNSIGHAVTKVDWNIVVEGKPTLMIVGVSIDNEQRYKATIHYGRKRKAIFRNVNMEKMNEFISKFDDDEYKGIGFPFEIDALGDSLTEIKNKWLEPFIYIKDLFKQLEMNRAIYLQKKVSKQEVERKMQDLKKKEEETEFEFIDNIDGL